jgi:hypothetical protein
MIEKHHQEQKEHVKEVGKIVLNKGKEAADRLALFISGKKE